MVLYGSVGTCEEVVKVEEQLVAASLHDSTGRGEAWYSPPLLSTMWLDVWMVIHRCE